MKTKIKVLIVLVLLTILFVLAHNLIGGILGQEEFFFFAVSFFFAGISLMFGFYMLFNSIFLNKRNVNCVKKNEHSAENPIKMFKKKETFGEKFADKITAGIGSWKFIIIQSIILIMWMILNVVAWTNSWDPYPFILLNLVLSFQAAYAAPIIMMSQNRTAARDRKKADWDLATDRRAERGIKQIQKDFVRLERKINKILKVLNNEENNDNTKKKS